MFKNRTTIILTSLVIGIISLDLLELNQVDLMVGLGRMVLYLIFFCTLFYSIYRLIKDKREISFLRKARPLIFGFILTAFLFFFSYLVETDGGKQRLITGGANYDPSFIHFQLFSDNTFKLLNSGPLGGSYYRGTYSLNKDTLRLNNDSLRYLYPTLSLVLRENAGKEKYFESVDTFKFNERLYIYSDNRKSR